MSDNKDNLIYLAIVFIVAVAFYASAWSNVEMSTSAKWFWTGCVAVIHGGLTCAIVAGWR